ncbi:FAD binding domain protein [Mycobacterium xenopi 3993]|nr:FAD binding domain protein [Mycobacterium xenopi 3993]
MPGPQAQLADRGIRYYDTVVDDARHTLTVARTAAHYGAVVRSSTQVIALLREGDRVTGVRVRDSEDGAVSDVRGHVVVNATGFGRTRSRRYPSSAAGFRYAPPRACTSWCRVTGSSATSRSSCAPRSR